MNWGARSASRKKRPGLCFTASAKRWLQPTTRMFDGEVEADETFVGGKKRATMVTGARIPQDEAWTDRRQDDGVRDG